MTRKNQPEHETYAVSLCFDDAFSEKIRAVVRALSSVTKNTVLLDSAGPVHVTLGMFHVPLEDGGQIRSCFSDFAAAVSPLPKIAFSAVDTFLDKVIFLSVDKSSKSFSRLVALNERLHEQLLPRFAPGANRTYVPGHFFPHVALAVKLSSDQCVRGTAALLDGGTRFGVELPSAASVCAVSLARCHPYKEIARVALSTDSLTPAQRHTVMSHIKSTGGALETALRSQLFRFGFRFRKNDRRLSGSPDIVFVHYRAVVFVNGCFWHAHGWKSGESLITSPFLDEGVLYSLSCGKFRMPTTNSAFWGEKFTKNRTRDIRDIESLLADGWRVGVVWECSILGKNRAGKIRSVAEAISFWLEDEQSVLFREF